MSKSFLGRINDGKGVIYKPESADVELSMDKLKDLMENGLPAPKAAHGADFIYTDDDPGSYPDIFENIETPAEEKDNLMVIAAMRCLSEGKDLQTFLDTEEIIHFNRWAVLQPFPVDIFSFHQVYPQVFT